MLSLRFILSFLVFAIMGIVMAGPALSKMHHHAIAKRSFLSHEERKLDVQKRTILKRARCKAKPTSTTASSTSPAHKSTSVQPKEDATKESQPEHSSTSTAKKAQNTPAANTGSSSSSGGTSQADITTYLNAHNTVRAQHGAKPLTWSSTLASAASKWASACVFQHSGGSLGPYGENLAAGTGDDYDIKAAVQSWTDEVSTYQEGVPSHFSQVVWKGTTQVGCGMAMCNGIFDPSFGIARYVVCEYSPQGNIIGEFPQNVQV